MDIFANTFAVTNFMAMDLSHMILYIFLICIIAAIAFFFVKICFEILFYTVILLLGALAFIVSIIYGAYEKIKYKFF